MNVVLLVDVEGWGAAGDVRAIAEGAGADHLVAEGIVSPKREGSRRKVFGGAGAGPSPVRQGSPPRVGERPQGPRSHL